MDTETISRFERGTTLPSLLTLEKISASLKLVVGELFAVSSAQPDDFASTLSACLAELEEADRTVAWTVLGVLEVTCVPGS